MYTRGRDFLKIQRERRDNIQKELDKENKDDICAKGRKKKKIKTFDNLFDICPCKRMSREACDCPAPQKVSER